LGGIKKFLLLKLGMLKIPTKKGNSMKSLIQGNRHKGFTKGSLDKGFLIKVYRGLPITKCPLSFNGRKTYERKI